MSEKETLPENNEPILTISGTLSAEDYIRSVRSRIKHGFIRKDWIVLLAYLVFVICLNIYGYIATPAFSGIPTGERLSHFFRYLLENSWLHVVIVAAGIAVIRIFHMWYVPKKMKNQFLEATPEGAPIIYRFFDDHFETLVNAEKQKVDLKANYSEIQRKIYEDDLCFVVRTRNTYSFHKTLMTPDEVEAVRKLLQERCPQKKPR